MLPTIGVSVSEQDVKMGVLNSPVSDPVALACVRAGMRNVRVGLWALTFEQAGKVYRASLPKEVTAFLRRCQFTQRHEILREDRKGKAVPFTFTLVPQEVEG